MAVGEPRGFGPHLFRILQNHVAVTIEGFDSREELAVVSARDKHLGARADGGLEDRQRACGELVLLYLRDLILPVVELAHTSSWLVGRDAYVNSLRGFAMSSLLHVSILKIQYKDLLHTESLRRPLCSNVMCVSVR